MSNEFRPIEKAPLYEIDKEGNVRTIKKQTPIIPFPIGSSIVNLNISEKVRKPFAISDLVKEVWDKNLPPFSPKKDEKSERAKDTAQMPSSGKITSTSDKGEQVAETMPNRATGHSPKVDKILKSDCSMAIKIWKMYEEGLSAKQIADIVGYPNAANVPGTIKKYKNNESNRKRADKVQI